MQNNVKMLIKTSTYVNKQRRWKKLLLMNETLLEFVIIMWELQSINTNLLSAMSIFYLYLDLIFLTFNIFLFILIHF